MAQDAAAWFPKHTDLLQGVRMLQLQLHRTAIDSGSRTSGLSIWGMLTSRFAGVFGHGTITTTAAAAILRSCPRTLSKVILQLQDDEDVTATPLHGSDCAIICAELAALPDLQSISSAGPGAAACLPHAPNLATTFSHLTCLRLGTIGSHAGVVQLLAGLPAGLLQLRLDVDAPDHDRIGDERYILSVYNRMMQQQRSLQTAHLTALKTLHVTGGGSFVVGQDSTLPPNVINMTLPVVLHEKPLLQLTHLQHLDFANIKVLSGEQPDGFARLARCLKQLTHLEIAALPIAEENAHVIMSALAAMPLKKLEVGALYMPPQEGAAADVIVPAAIGVLLGRLTSLTTLMMLAGALAWADLAGSLARLTGLRHLAWFGAECEEYMAGPASGMFGDVPDCESFVDAIAGLQQLRILRANAVWFGSGYAEGDGPHPVMRLQAATQLRFLDLWGFEDHPGEQSPDWAALLKSLPGAQLGADLVPLKD
uniref:FBD domain-containing protein n=1 Tax=Tetradesmus obliquus TaxID=3088 RepID=A0A383VVL6_TETOB|eukprot:jgi/Sobl393_1/8603/SZX68889.1